MVNVFGDSIGEERLGNLQMSRKVIELSGKYADYVNEIQASHKLGYPAYRIAPEGSPTSIFMYENKFFCLGAHKQHVYELTPKARTKILHRLNAIEEFEVKVGLQVMLNT